jgi:ABC-type phosphate transport system substrate-binding protein
MMRKANSWLGLALLLYMGTAGAAGGVAVVVHPDSGVDSLSREQVQDIYLGKMTHFPSGEKIKPVDQDEGEATRADFYEAVVGKTLSQIKAYWATKIFSGAGLPPDQVGDGADVVRWVAEHPQGIGFVGASRETEGVQVVLEVGGDSQ